MSKAEKENRVHSFALEFLERQQIVPNLYADQIIRGYKEGYNQAEKDLELTWKDIELIVNIDKDTDNEESIIGARKNEEHYREVLKRFKDLKNGTTKR